MARAPCRGHCTKTIECSKHPCVRSSPYLNGYKYCSECERYFITTLYRCECCTTPLRSSPITKKKKKNYHITEEIMQIERAHREKVRAAAVLEKGNPVINPVILVTNTRPTNKKQ